MLRAAFDFETLIVAPARQAPRAVCMSYALDTGGADVLIARDGVAYLYELLKSGAYLEGANTAFDVLVSVGSSYLADIDWREMLSEWVRAYEEHRVTDVLLDQKLLDLAAGRYRGGEFRFGKYCPFRYALDDVAMRHLRMQLEKESFWRKNYALLENIPIAQYPAEARAYALGDSVATRGVSASQEHARHNDPRIQAKFPGRDPLADRHRQMMGALALKVVSAYGIRTDGAAVERLAHDVTTMQVELRDILVEKGLVRRTVTRDMKAIAERCEAVGAPSARKADREASGDSLLIKLTDWQTYEDELANAGLLKVEYSRDTKAAAKVCYEAFKASGRAVPRTESYVEGESGEYDCVSLDIDSCERSDNPTLVDYAEYASLSKTLSNDLKALRRGTVEPIHPRVEELLQTGRTSMSNPNLQNVRRLPGIRECFKPRDGYVFLDADYPMLELHTHAQVCYWQLGYSKLGDALRAGDDPHLRMAATILNMTYQGVEALYVSGDPKAKNARTAGKGANFGVPGGLGKETFAHVTWKAYRIKMTEDEAAVLIKQYKQTWTEINSYFKWINSLQNVDGTFDIVQPWSQRLRADASYCAACNSPFQGLGADIAKLALWLVFKATAGLSELGTADPLYGCHMVNFVHDSIMMECPLDRITEAARRLQQLMKLAGDFILPDVGMREIDVLATYQWSNKAKAKWVDGRLVPWEIREACRAALAKAGERTRDEAYDFLIKEEWPRDICREIVLERYGGVNVVGTGVAA